MLPTISQPDIAAAQRLPQCLEMLVSPCLAQVKLPLTRSASQQVPAALQEEPARLVETHCGIGAVDLLLDDDLPSSEHRSRLAFQIFVARLDPRPLNVRGARVALHGELGTHGFGSARSDL